MGEIGRAPSIIDGCIQHLQKKLKDASIEDKKFLLKSIDALESLWSDMSLNYIRTNAPTTVLGRPTATGNFPYHREWTAANKVTENGCDLYDMTSNDKFTKWTLVLAEEENKNRFLFKSMDACETVSRIRPFDKISYPVQKRGKQERKQVAGFLYPHCQTLKKYVENFSVDLTCSLPNTIKGYVVALVALEKEFENVGEKMDKYHFDRTVCVVQKKIGSIIYLTSPGQNQEISWEVEHQYLAQYIGPLFPIKPYGLEILLECMSTANNLVKRRRLLKAPYFLSDQEKIMKFVPMMYYVTCVCSEFENPYLNWVKEAEKYGVAVDNVLEYGDGNYKIGRKQFIRFLNNCVKHLIVDQSSVGGSCELIKKMIDEINPNLLDDFFYNSYTVKRKRIPMLDDF